MHHYKKITTSAHFEDIAHAIRIELSKACHSVKICVAWINSNYYSAIFETLAKRNVSIEIIFNDDNTNTKYGPTNEILTDATLYPIKTRLQSAIMHNKFCIIDNETLITGSYNWSAKAKNSFENILIIKNDYALIKQYLHEFEDIKLFAQLSDQSKISLCGYKSGVTCRSHSYRLAILGPETGIHNESEISIWKICAKNNHAQLVSSSDEIFYQDSIGLKDENDQDSDITNVDTLKYQFTNERNLIEKLNKNLISRHDTEIHAIGFVSMTNDGAYYKGYESAEWAISMLWRNMYYRKIIPEIIYEHEGDTDEIIAQYATE